MSESEFKCIIPFPNQDPAFSHGMEVGMIWEQLNHNAYERRAVRVENEEVLRAVVAHFGKAAKFEESGTDGWLWMDVEKFQLRPV
jgi:hypothetical protein